MDTAPLLQFVADWTAHYSPTWLQLHTDDYLHARTCLEQLSQTLNRGIRRFDPDIINLRPKDMIPDIRPDAPSLRIHIISVSVRVTALFSAADCTPVYLVLPPIWFGTVCFPILWPGTAL